MRRGEKGGGARLGGGWDMEMGLGGLAVELAWVAMTRWVDTGI